MAELLPSLDMLRRLAKLLAHARCSLTSGKLLKTAENHLFNETGVTIGIRLPGGVGGYQGEWGAGLSGRRGVGGEKGEE